MSFDILIFFAVIYFVGSALMKRVVAAQKKAGTPPRRPGGPGPSGAPPWMRPSVPSQTPSSGPTPPASAREAQPASGSRRSTFESLYEAIRDQLDPSSAEGETLSSSEAPAPAAESLSLEQPSGSMQSPGSMESYGIMEGASNLGRYASPGPADAGHAQPVRLTGLGLHLNADTLVQGVIFSEILNRKRRGVRR